MLYATFEDVDEMYEGILPEAQRDRIEALIRRASAHLEALVPALVNNIENNLVDVELPNGMVVDAVLRIFRNPAGATQHNAGPFSASLNTLASRNEISFPQDQIAILRDAGDTGIPSTFRVGIPGHEGRRVTMDADGQYTYTPEWPYGF